MLRSPGFLLASYPPGGLISSPLVLVPGRAEGLERSPLGLMSSRPGWLAVAAELDALSRAMKEGSHPRLQCQRLSQARKCRATQVSEDGAQRVVFPAEPSGIQSGRTRQDEARRRRGDEWLRQGSGTSRVSLRAGSHHELGIVLAWELAPRPTGVEQARLALQRWWLARWLAMSLLAWLLARSGEQLSCPRITKP
jgi:hypothetical protein